MEYLRITLIVIPVVAQMQNTHDEASYSITLYALRPISHRRGDHLQVHGDCQETRETRRTRLNVYYFHCQCQYCDLPDSAAVAASDAARLEMRDWEEKGPINPGKWCSDLSLPDDHLVKFYKRAIRLHEQEGMTDANYASHMQMLTIVYGLLGDEKNYRHWCLKAIERMEVMRKTADIVTMKHWLTNPQVNFEWWGRRKVIKACRQ